MVEVGPNHDEKRSGKRLETEDQVKSVPSELVVASIKFVDPSSIVASDIH